MAAALWLGGALPASAQEYCKTSRGNMSNGYHYEMWIQDGTSGSACMTVAGIDARFKTVWSLGGYGFVARVGKVFDQTKTAEQLGWISSDFEVTKSGSGSAWMGIYGWTVDPLIEYYIIEDWIGGRVRYQLKDTITVDDGQYDVYFNTRVNQPSIQGTKTFDQWYSVRKTPRSSGHISISEHMNHWKRLGMQPGKLYESKLKVEGLGGSGTVEFTKGTVIVGTKLTSIRMHADRSSRERGILFEHGGAPGALSLVTASGAEIRSLRIDGGEPAHVPIDGLTPGVYFLRFAERGKAPVSRAFLVP